MENLLGLGPAAFLTGLLVRTWILSLVVIVVRSVRRSCELRCETLGFNDLDAPRWDGALLAESVGWMSISSRREDGARGLAPVAVATVFRPL